MTLANELHLDPAAETERIAAALRQQLGETLNRRGLVVGMSGGIDSSVCAALAVRAVGPDHVFGLLMPEHDSAGESLGLGGRLAEQLKIPYAVEQWRNGAKFLEAVYTDAQVNVEVDPKLFEKP